MKGLLLSYEMKFRIVLSLVILFFSFSLSAQPKTALSFDGNDDRVDLPNILPTSYTKEAWINSTLGVASGSTNNIISGLSTAFWFPADQGWKLSAGNSSPFTAVQDPTPLQANTWYHVAVTYDAATTTMTLYKNGVQVSQNTGVGSVTESELHLGNYGGFAGTNYVGLMDEVRIWDIALTQTQIRDRMCTKIKNTDPLLGNLVAYYAANEGSGTTLVDSTANNSDGTLVNGTLWATSGAAIGDASAYDYTSATKTAFLNSLSSSEKFTVTSEVGSNPDGIQIYRVDTIPDNTTGLSGLGGNNKYFGVFQIGGTSPTYQAVYDYGTTYGGNETSYRLYKRTDNAAASWADAGASQDVNANTMTVTGQSTEYMLGSIGTPLPVNFTNFVLRKENNGVRLSWSTAQEINNSGFVVQHSLDKGKTWSDLGFVAASNSGFDQKTYGFLDGNPAKGLNLYRLKQIDFDGSFKLSEIRVISYLTNAGITVYPVPAASQILVDLGKTNLLNTTVKLIDVQGREVKQILLSELQQRIPIADLQNGMYMLQFADGSISKFVKQ